MSDQNTILPDILTDETKIFILSAATILVCLIMCKNITHAIPTYTVYNSENSVSHIDVRRSSKPIAYYSNSQGVSQALFDDIRHFSNLCEFPNKV